MHGSVPLSILRVIMWIPQILYVVPQNSFGTQQIEILNLWGEYDSFQGGAFKALWTEEIMVSQRDPLTQNEMNDKARENPSMDLEGGKWWLLGVEGSVSFKNVAP